MVTLSRFDYISLFSGIAGLDIGLWIAAPQARCVCYVEREFKAAEILVQRIKDGCLGDAPVWSDVSTFDGQPWRGLVDGIIGGFPCTDLSVAGKQDGIYGKHSGLWSQFARIIEEVRPKWVFIENVPGLFTADGEKFRCVCGWSDRWRGIIQCESGPEAVNTDSRCASNDGREGARLPECSNERVRRQCHTDSEHESKRIGDCEMVHAGKAGRLPDSQVSAVSLGKKRAGPNLPTLAGNGVAREVQRDEANNSREAEGVPGCESLGGTTESARDTGTREGLRCPVCGEQIDEKEEVSFRRALGDVLWQLASLGFTSEWCCLRASDVGAPHQRKRVFILAHCADSRCDDERQHGGGLSLLRARSVERSNSLALSPLGGCGELRESPRQKPQPNGTGDAMAEHLQRWPEYDEYRDAQGRDGLGRGGSYLADSRDRQFQEQGRIAQGRAGIGPAGETLAVPAEPRLPQREDCTRNGGEASGIQAAERTGDELSDFHCPPGPSELERWREVPEWLWPAIKPNVRCLVNGTSILVDESRADQLRALGNGVVPLQAAAAFGILVGRIARESGNLARLLIPSKVQN